MRFMVIVKATEASERGNPPDPAAMIAMSNFNKELLDAGVIVEMNGLTPTKRGRRVQFDGDKRTVIDGPFAEAKELVAGYWIWQCESLDEAVEWAKRCPSEAVTCSGGSLEIRPVWDITKSDDVPEIVRTRRAAWDARKQG